MKIDDPVVAYMQVPKVELPALSPSGRYVAFVSNRRGPREPVVYDRETGERESTGYRNFTQSGVHSAYIWGHSDEYLFVRAGLAEGETDLHLITQGGERQTAVREEGMLVPFDTGPDGRYLFYYNSRTRALRRFDRRDGKQTTVAENIDRTCGDIGAVSPDGRHIAYSKDGAVHVAAPDGSNRVTIDTPESGELLARSWHPDGQRLLIHDSERSGVYSLTDRSVEWISTDHGDVPLGFCDDGSIVAHNSGIPVRYSNDGERHIADGDDATQRNVPYWAGTGSVVDGGVLMKTRTHDSAAAVTLMTPDGRRERLVTPSYDHVDPDTFVEPEIVEYEASDGERFEGALYQRDGTEEPSPAVVILYGGIRAPVTRFRRYVQLLVHLGYTVWWPSYRFAPHSDAEHDDFAAATRWIQQRPDVDADRVAAYGHSHGGYNVYMQMTRYPTLYAAGVASVGKTDLEALERRDDANFRRGELPDLDDDPEEWQRQSPLPDASEVERPLLIHHGSSDFAVPVEQARKFRDALIDAGVQPGAEFEYYEFGDEGHASRHAVCLTRKWRVITRFLERRL